MGTDAVRKNQNARLSEIISRPREIYAEFQQLAARTDEALYRAIAEVYALKLQIDADTGLRAEFDQLLQLYTAGKCANETLVLVKYAFFPDTLQSGPGHKPEINKASRYAKLINLALAHDVASADFVTFARTHGIQRTALAPRGFKSSRVGSGLRRRRLGRSFGRPPDLAGAAFLCAALAPLETWCYTSAVAARLAEAVGNAVSRPQKITLTIYLNGKRAVVTGVTGQAWSGVFPAGAVRMPTPQLPEPPVAPPAAAPASHASRPINPGRRDLPRGVIEPLRAGRARRRSADGFISPSWR